MKNPSGVGGTAKGGGGFGKKMAGGSAKIGKGGGKGGFGKMCASPAK